MELDPSKYDILLVGPRVARLEPFFSGRGYRTTACQTGAEGLNLLRSSKQHVVAIELELTDLGAREFMRQALEYAPLSAYVLLDDPSKSGMIVSALVEGADAYIPTPPDENRLFSQIARHAHAAAARGGAPTETEQYETELEKARGALASTGARVRALTDEKATLEKREATYKAEVEKLQKALASAKARGGSKGGGTVSDEELAELKASKDFASFLETENDALKEEINALKSKLDELGARLKSVGLPMPSLDGLGERTGEVQIDLALGGGAQAEEEFFEVRSDPEMREDPFAEGTDTGERRMGNINSPMSSDGPTIHTPVFQESRLPGGSSPSEDSIELDLESVLRSGAFEENTDSQLGEAVRGGRGDPLNTEFSSGPVGAPPGSRTEAGDATAFDEPTVNAAEMGGGATEAGAGIAGPFTGFEDQSSVFARGAMGEADPLANMPTTGETEDIDSLPPASDTGDEAFGWTAAPTMAVDSPYTGDDAGPGSELDVDDESAEFGEPTLNPHMDLKNIPTQSGNGPPVGAGEGAFEDATLMLDPVEAVEMAKQSSKLRGKG